MNWYRLRQDSRLNAFMAGFCAVGSMGPVDFDIPRYPSYQEAKLHDLENIARDMRKALGTLDAKIKEHEAA